MRTGNSSKVCAVVDELRVQRLLRAITDDLSVLRIEATADAQRRLDPLWLRGIKYTFVTAIEACLDIAQHLCASEGWGPPRDNGDAMTVLGKHEVLETELAASMRRSVGFRNVLVHEYVAVDDAVVIARLGDLSDLNRYVGAIGDFLA